MRWVRDGAVQTSPASSRSFSRSRPASGWSRAITANIASPPSSWRSVPSGRRSGASASWKHIAACSVPAATAAPSSSPDASTASTCTSGRSSRRRAMAAGMTDASALGNEPIRSVSRSAALSSATCASAWESRSATASACASSSAPASVGVGPPGPRSSSRTPSWRSSAETCWETAGCVSASTSPAFEKERCRTTSRNVSRRRGSKPSGPVALLELLAGSAPARVVAPELLVLADAALLDHRRRLVRLLAGLSVGARLVVQRAARVLERGRAAALLLRHALVAVLALDLDLDVVDHAREVGPDGVHQVLEERERLVLVGDDRLDLREPAQVDALAQIVHVVQVLAPAVVDRLQQQVALERAHQLLAEIPLALVVELLRVLRQQPLELVAVDGLAVDLVRPEVD